MNQAAQIPVPLDRYAAALAGEDPLASLKKGPKRVKKLVKGVHEKLLRRRPAEGKWSVKEILAHLADGEVVLSARLRFIAGMDRPPIHGYDQDSFVARLGVDRVDAEDLLEQFALARKLTMALLARIDDADYARVGLHSERGEVTIRSMVDMYSGHDRIHEDQIRRTLDAVRSRKAEKVELRDEMRAKKRDGKSGKGTRAKRNRRKESEPVLVAAP